MPSGAQRGAALASGSTRGCSRRPAADVRSRSLWRARPSARPARAATPVAVLVPGVFIRASLPRPSTSWAGTIASRARGRARARSAPSAARRDRRRRALGRHAVGARHQPASCRCRACRCRRRRPRAWFASRCGFASRRRTRTAGPTIPGSPSSSRSRSTGGVITPRSSAISGSSPSSRAAASKTARPGPRRQRPRSGGVVARRDGPVGDEAAEVVDARQVDQLEASAGSARSTSGTRVRASPASRRAGCPRAGRSRSSRPAGRRRRARAGRARGGPRGRRRRARRRSARRRSAARRARRRSAQRAPLALEAHLVGDRASPGERRPVADPVRVRARRSARSPPRVTGASGPRAGRRARERRRGAVRRAVLVGRAERQDLPPRLPRRGEPVDERGTPRGPSRPPGSEVGWSRTPLSGRLPRCD